MYKNAQHEGKGQIMEDDEEEEPEPQDEDVEEFGPGPSQQPPLPSLGMSRKSFPNPNVIQ